jgi:four helix bundle protein
MHWKELEVWKRAHMLVLEIYKVTSGYPSTERYGLTDQIRRASYSVTANIVEGQSRNTTKEYLYFLYNARGSVEEVRYFVLLSKELGYINDDVHQNVESGYETVSKMLNGLIKSLKT